MQSLVHRVITWGERRFQTDVRYLVHGGSWLLLGQVVGVVVSFLLAIGYANFLPMEVYGTYKYVLSLLGIFSIFTLPGMETAAQRGVAQGKEAVFWTSFKWRVLGGIVAMCASLLLGLYYFFLNGNTQLGLIFIIIAPLLVFLEPLAHYGGLLIGRRMFRENTFYGTLLQIGMGIALLISILLIKNVVTLVAAYVIISVLLRGIFFIVITKRFPTNNIGDNESLEFGKHLSIVDVFGILSSRLDALLLFHFIGPTGLAVYSFARAITDNLQSAFKIITGAVAFPKLASLEKAIIKKTLGRKVCLAHQVTIPISLGIILAIPYLYQYLFPAYMASVPYAQAMIALLAFAPLRLISTAITAKASARIYYTSTLSGIVLRTIFLFVLVPAFGIWGAIAATAAQQAIGNSLNWYLFKKM